MSPCPFYDQNTSTNDAYFDFVKIRIKILHKRKPNATEECLERIPRMARQFEEIMYKQAPSKDNYDAFHDDRALKQRLQQVAFEVKMKNDSKKGKTTTSLSKNNNRFKIKSFRRRKFEAPVLCKIDEER